MNRLKNPFATILAGAIKEAAATPELKDRMTAVGMEVRYLGPAEFASEWDRMEAQLTPIIQAFMSEEKKK